MQPIRFGITQTAIDRAVQWAKRQYAAETKALWRRNCSKHPIRPTAIYAQAVHNLNSTNPNATQEDITEEAKRLAQFNAEMISANSEAKHRTTRENEESNYLTAYAAFVHSLKNRVIDSRNKVRELVENHSTGSTSHLYEAVTDHTYNHLRLIREVAPRTYRRFSNIDGVRHSDRQALEQISYRYEKSVKRMLERVKREKESRTIKGKLKLLFKKGFNGVRSIWSPKA